MSLVGGFPNLRQLTRVQQKGPVNPLDKSTLVSIYPKAIKFVNITLQPGRWFLEAGSVEKPALMVLGPSSWWKDVGPDEPLIEIVQSSVQIAESLVRDYLNGMFAVNQHDTLPGLFWVPGEVDSALLKSEKKYQNLLKNALTHQMNYYRTLIKYADAMWARSNGNPLVINDEMRLAARTLGLRDKDWMSDHRRAEMAPCFACGEFKNPEYAICKSCHTIDPNHPKASLIQRVAAIDPFQNLTDPKQPEGKKP